MSDAMILQIENADQRLGLLPALGGSAAFWEVRRDGAWQAIWRPYEPAEDGKRVVANFPLVPFSNRISGGGITVGGVFYPMTPNREGAFPIHGNGWMHEWEVREHTAQTIELVVESHCKHDYPWDYFATQRYRLTDEGMTMRLEVEHLGDTPMPYGLGWHPYTLRGNDVQEPRLQFKTDGYWQGDDNGIPVQHVRELPDGWDFNTLCTLDHGRIDHNFSGWDGRVRVERDDIDLRIESQTTEPAGLTTAILFRPEDQIFFCVEPVTHITDAFNRPGMPGLRMLQKGERMSLEVVHRLSHIGA
ncbi:MAG: aldose 1-epimerase [Rhodocyclales bacterium]|nr:aldose 1-epimerase [Rhodocyclales bacterium]